LPVHLKGLASQSLTDKINNISTDPEFARTIRENIISYTSVLKDGKFKIEDYLNAVAYVSYKLMKYTNQESYKRTFPKRYATLVANGADDKTISAYVAAYNKGKLVNLILEQTLVPNWVLNQEVYQEAINTQAMLMTTSKSDLVRTQAANSLLTHLKRPEKAQVELSIGEAETSGMAQLKDALMALAQQQQALIGGGVNTRVIAHQKFNHSLVDGSIEDAQEVPLVPDVPQINPEVSVVSGSGEAEPKISGGQPPQKGLSLKATMAKEFRERDY
jgi:hypothetical protein